MGLGLGKERDVVARKLMVSFLFWVSEQGRFDSKKLVAAKRLSSQ